MYADPGYHGEPRMPLDTDERVTAAWARMMTTNQGYDPVQRETIKARIRKEAFLRGLELVTMAKREARRIVISEEIRMSAPHDVLTNTQVAPEVETGGDPDAQQALANHEGCMVALYPSADVAGRLAVDGGEPAAELHVTLAYLGAAAGIDLERLQSVVAGVAEGAVLLTGTVSGLGVFTANPEEPVTYASVDVPGLPVFRQRLFDALVDASFPVATSHGYTPHMTLAYGDQRDLVVPNLPLEFGEVTVVAAGKRFSYPLRGDEAPYVEGIGPAEPASEAYEKESERIRESKETPEAKAPHAFKAAEWTHPNGHPRCSLCGDEESISGRCNDAAADEKALAATEPIELSEWGRRLLERAKQFGLTRDLTTVVDRPSGPEEVVEDLHQTRAFVTEVAGKTILTAPVETLKAENFGANPHYLWMEGAFVGAEEPNRNGALWSTGDLEFGELTVKNGPVNWLHEARHVIGSIVDGRLVTPVEGASAGALSVPHIRATAAIWKWIYPEEAEIIEIASEVGKLYYSMECISESVRCVGEQGCGESYPYMKAIKGMACPEMNARASTRRFENPTFLGGAVIVPPVRPGWAHADASVLRQAAALAEAAYDQAGRPDVEAAIWEQLMAEVVSFAQA